jgi:peptidoglycan/xylan/chitin deacetylase (PgdA/CDA1 family)
MTYALLYHDIATPDKRDATGFPGATAAPYKLTPGDFAAHLEALARAGAGIGLIDAGEVPQAALTFDDGGASALEAAAALEARGWRGHFFVTTGRVGTPGFLDADGVRQLHARGHVVGSHSHTHPTYMGRLAEDELLAEWTTSRELLADILGELPSTASVPGGFLSRGVIEQAAKAGYRLLMTSEPSARLRRHGEMAVLGRFGIWASTPPEQAGRYATGSRAARGRLWVTWQAKTVAKHISPGTYERLRRARARRD